MSLTKILLGDKLKVKAIAVLNIFSFVNIGEHVGSGYPLILKTTKERNYHISEVYDMFNPDVTKITIFIKKLPLQGENPDIEVQNPDIEKLINKLITKTIINNINVG